MHNLRNAIGREDDNQQSSMSRFGFSKMVNKSKNATIWALDEEDDQVERNHHGQKQNKNVESLILDTFRKDPTFSEMVLYELIEQTQTLYPDMAEQQSLEKLQKSIYSLLECKGLQEACQIWLSNLQESLIRKIKKMRRKDKKSELLQFDKIVQNNFKRKQAAYINQNCPMKHKYLTVNEQLYTNGKNLEGSSRRNSSSQDGKLSHLLSKSKVTEESKKELQSAEQPKIEESISYSVVSQNMNIKQRNRRQVHKKEEQTKRLTSPRQHKKVEDEEGDQAFMFFRPKGNRKK